MKTRRPRPTRRHRRSHALGPSTLPNGDSHVLHAVSFALNAGRVLALLGRNGAGKTTCMNAIIGFIPPRGGEIRLFGETISQMSPEAISRKGMGLVPQGRRVFPTLTVRENLVVARQSRNSASAHGRSSACSRSFRPWRAAAATRRLTLRGRTTDARDRRALMGTTRVLLWTSPPNVWRRGSFARSAAPSRV